MRIRDQGTIGLEMKMLRRPVTTAPGMQKDDAAQSEVGKLAEAAKVQGPREGKN